MTVIADGPPAAGRPCPNRHRMGIVEADKALARSIVQCQRIAQAMRPFDARFDPTDNETDVIRAFRINEECHTIQRKQRVETSVPPNVHARCYHQMITHRKPGLRDEL
jgi:hypothetical protein